MASKTFSSLSIPNYRTYFFGLLIANIGGWMASTAKAWLVLVDLTHDDATALGWLTGLLFAPALITMPIAAAITDRFPKRRIMLATLTWQAINSAILAALVISGNIRLWHVFLLAFLDGTASALSAPAQQAFVSEIVPHNALANAISLNSAQFNGARLLGPGIAGILIAAFGTGTVLAINCICFIWFIASLLRIRGDQMTPAALQHGKGQLRDGLRYVKSRTDIMLLIFIAFMMGNFGFNFAISNAVMARTTFGKAAGEYGLLGSIMGIGALAAALWSARRTYPRLRHSLIALAGFAFFSAISALSPTYTVFALTLIPIGLCAITVIVTSNALIQLSVAPEYRGRVMALWSALLVGGTPFVAPIVGACGTYLGPRSTVWFEGTAVLITLIVTSIWIIRSENIHFSITRQNVIPRLNISQLSHYDDAPPSK
ncbi:MAG: MFS transporter [Propionibacteriaceae bacterium]